MLKAITKTISISFWRRDRVWLTFELIVHSCLGFSFDVEMNPWDLYFWLSTGGSSSGRETIILHIKCHVLNRSHYAVYGLSQK